MAQTAMPIDIPPQSLAAAVAQLAEATGIVVVGESAAFDGKHSTGLSGNMTPRAALRALLSGSGLTMEAVDDSNIAVFADMSLSSQNAPDDPVDLGTLVLSGELIVRDVQDSPTSATVATGDDMERRGDKDVMDLIKRVPNVSQSAGGTSFVIRGIQQSSFGGTSSPAVSVQVDGAELQDFNSELPNWDLEQIEVLRGPQSTQQGRNALAGAVIIRTRDPEYFDSYRLRLGASERHGSEVAFSVNQVLDPDRLALRFAGQRRRADGWVYNETRNEEGDRTEFDNLRLKLRFDPNDALSVVLSHAYQRTFDGIGNALRAEYPDDIVKETDVDEHYDTFYHTTGLRLRYDLAPGWTLASETTYRVGESGGELDFDRGPASVEFTDFNGDNDRFQQDLRLIYESAGLSATAGAFYYKASQSTTNAAQAVRPLPGLGPQLIFADQTLAVETENWAVFGEAEIAADNWLPGLSFVIGARYDYEQQKRNTDTDVALAAGPPPFPIPILGQLSPKQPMVLRPSCPRSA